MRTLLIVAGIAATAAIAIILFRRSQTPALKVGPNPVQASPQGNPKSMIGPAILALAPKVKSWFSMPTAVASDAPPPEFNFSEVAESYYLPGTYGSDEDNPD